MVNNELSVPIMQNIAKLADTAYKYLPDNLQNQNYKRELLIDIQKGIKAPNNEIIYNEIIASLADYLEKVEINAINGTIDVSPKSGNAPLSTTLRAKVEDPSGTQISNWNYTWFIDNAGEKIVIGRGPSINYTFRNEGKFTVFLDVVSTHKNSSGFTDVLPFRSRAEVLVNEKVATLVIKVNSSTVTDNNVLKFNPDTADYGLLIDATSSLPTAGARFSKTEWDFGNGITKSYSGGPKVERVRYATQGDYELFLRMTTNEGKVIEKYFLIEVHDPIAKIEVNREDWFIGDSFTFAAKSGDRYRDLTYNWEITNIDTDKVVFQNADKLFTYNFKDKGRYNVSLRVRQSSGEIDQDNRVVYVTSQSPIAEFETNIPASNKPNRVYLDASRSFDPDISDDGNLKYDWFIDGNKVILEDSVANGSIGYYVFDSVGNHSINLEVTDLDGITSTKKWTIDIKSILSVDFYAFPRVIPRNGFIKFIAESPEAQIFEWNFGDGKSQGGTLDNVTHTYEKSGSFDVTLKVSDKNNMTNTFKRTVYVSDSDEPYSILDVKYDTNSQPEYEADACGWDGAYVINRVQNVLFDASESINIDGQTTWLEYSWKIGQTTYSTSQTVTQRFDEIWCFPVKLTVKSKANAASHSSSTMVEVRNVLPTLTSLGIQIENPEADPLVIRVNANGATDPDGVIQSYLWYYYTDIDNSPQDFRSTISASTTFVIPKVTWNYYFMAILKDNNEARITSEEITGSRYFTTITGDNINTPIIELSVNDNSTIIGEEVTFKAKVSNILGQDISKNSEYSWDFDGDGFYDTQTKEPIVNYSYKKSGEFYAKVKVKHKGISSTRNVTMNVSNKLVADFQYISIWNKFIFFDSSLGQIEDRQWELWDGTKKTGTSFEYTYTDKASTHSVTLKVSEGTVVKEVTKDVSKNFRNVLKSRGNGLVVFTTPELDKNDTITLKDQSEKVFIYLGESTPDAVNYIIDYDIEQDSDLNGGADDDENNKGTSSYVSGSVVEIPMSPYKTQVVRAYITDESGAILGSQDITIIKEYIEEQNIDPDMIIFEDVTESEKEKIESLKELLMVLPQQQRLKSLSYIQKLQENWNDSTEKTRTILDFEDYIFELNLPNENEIITLLESLLVEGQDDQSNNQITYQALVNLIPKEIVCPTESWTCYESLIAKLDAIKASSDVEANKIMWSEILDVIGTSDLLSNEQKLDFKAVLAMLVYGDIGEIPDSEKQEIIDQTPTGESSSSWVLWVLLTILKVIGYIILVFIVLVLWIFIFYKIFNKDKSLSFSWYVTKITSGGSKKSWNITSSEERDDILSELLWDSSQSDETKSDVFSNKKEDPLADTKQESKASPKKETKESTDTPKTPPVQKTAEEEQVPDWLKWSFTATDTSPSKQSTTPKKPEQSGVTAPQSQAKTDTNTQTLSPKESKQNNALTADSFDIEKETKLESNTQVPDWLKGSFDTEESSDTQTDSKKTDTKKSSVSDTKNDGILERKLKWEVSHNVSSDSVSKNIEDDAPSKNAEPEPTISTLESDVSVPDWLKSSFDTNEDVIDDTKTIEAKAEQALKKTPKKSETPKKTDTPIKKSDGAPKDTSSKDDTQKSEELWDDGMKIPDWLKSDDSK